jgi:hypothetical protein
MNYGENDLRVLKALHRGEAPTVGSHHRVHLEMLGLAVDGAAGLRITPNGAKLAVDAQLPPAIIYDTRDPAWRQLDEQDEFSEAYAMEAAPPGTGMDTTPPPAE